MPFNFTFDTYGFCHTLHVDVAVGAGDWVIEKTTVRWRNDWSWVWDDCLWSFAPIFLLRDASEGAIGTQINLSSLELSHGPTLHERGRNVFPHPREIEIWIKFLRIQLLPLKWHLNKRTISAVMPLFTSFDNASRNRANQTEWNNESLPGLIAYDKWLKSLQLCLGNT